MHMRGTPRTMSGLVDYDHDLVAQVRDSLVALAAQARSEQVWIDPGIGFAKTSAGNTNAMKMYNAAVQAIRNADPDRRRWQR